MKGNKPILRVAVRSPLWQCFDYLPPEEVDAQDWQPGQRVKVPFGRREVVGMLLEIVDKSDFPYEQLKNVIAVIDATPILSESLLRLYRWASDYYHHPVGDVILGTLPKLLRQGRALIASENHSECNIFPSEITLNEKQKIALDAITQSNGFQTFLLEGVTGSGKTEVYLQSIASVLQADKQALVLVPEIGLTPQTVDRFRRRFGMPIALLHSELSDRERLRSWCQATSGEAKIIIGTRSAVFVSTQNLGIIIIDETHDTSFKQQSGFRYSARDVAVMRGRMENIPVVLGSATPSLESLYNAQRSRYQLLRLPERAGAAKPPTVSVINLCDKKTDGGMTDELITSIRKHLDNDGQVLLFLNRRGYAPTLLCHHCGWMAMCNRCDVRMTLHFHPERLCCHHCGSQKAAPKICGDCRQAELINIGVGTERLEDALQKIFPEETIVRIDRDSTRKKGSLQALLEKIHNREANLLIGTQMLSKGHHFPNLTLVAIIDADGGLYGTDFRAVERMAQLVVQVSGRAGRVEQQGEVLMQTHHPEHPLLQLLLSKGYPAFSDALLRDRKMALLPPYSHVALLRAEGVTRDQPFRFLEIVKNLLKPNLLQSVDVLGPIPAPMEKRAGRYRAQLLLQSKERPALHKVCQPLMQQLSNHPMAKRVRWSLDIDPQEML